ncbi:hypothetical protein C8F04DRAFT_1190629 [Mycena alexandri]|uniref:Uncharacterized protein n=1 Tax=Mycena alexandri TaxID=1745969 RepID=A0AAD6SIY0_9AGAR|nr:hypothetical protein C8F04DRAFT_1190629 [Mycena alexandri]
MEDLGLSIPPVKLEESLRGDPPLDVTFEGDIDFLADVRAGYARDDVLKHVIANPEHFALFTHDNGLLYCKNPLGANEFVNRALANIVIAHDNIIEARIASSGKASLRACLSDRQGSGSRQRLVSHFSATLLPPSSSTSKLLLVLQTLLFSVKYTTRPADIPAPPDFDLSDINAENVKREKHNKTSIVQTRAYVTARASAAGVGSLDVGHPLKAFLAYSDGDRALLVGSKEVVDLTGPLPGYLTMWVARQRLDVAEKDLKEKERREKERAVKEAEKAIATRPIFGTLKMTNPRPIGSTISGPVAITQPWHTSLYHKIYFPLHWWSDDVLRRASATPHAFPCETITTSLSSSGTAVTARVVNVSKVMKDLGDEDSYKFTPGLWHRAIKNMLASFQYICAPPDPANPLSFSIAVELEGHINYFAKLDVFDDVSLFNVWYAVERELRYKIFTEGLFNLDYYEQRWNIALQNHKTLRDLGLIDKDGVPSQSVGMKRTAPNDGNSAPPKGPRLNGGGRGRSGTPGSRGGTPGDREGSVVPIAPQTTLRTRLPSRTARPSSQLSTETTSAPRGPFGGTLTPPSALPTISTKIARVGTASKFSMYALSAAAATPPSPATDPAEESAPELSYREVAPDDLLFLGHIPTDKKLRYVDLVPFVHPRPPLPRSPSHLSALLDRTVQPYNVSALESLLVKHALEPSYPHLIRNLRDGFPLGLRGDN